MWFQNKNDYDQLNGKCGSIRLQNNIDLHDSNYLPLFGPGDVIDLCRSVGPSLKSITGNTIAS